MLKLQKLPQGTTARAGYLADFGKPIAPLLLRNQSNANRYMKNIVPFSPTMGRNETTPKIIARASTFKFIPKSSSLPASETTPEDNHGFPAGTHWVDWAEPGTIAVIDQPNGQHCAVLGGIMAVRMKYMGVQGAVVNGRVRDLGEIMGCRLPVCFSFLSFFVLVIGADLIPTGLGSWNLHRG